MQHRMSDITTGLPVQKRVGRRWKFALYEDDTTPISL